MADSRGYFKVTNGFPEHSKIIEAGGDAGWLHICALAHCSRNLTDGLVPVNLVPRLSDRDNPKQLASKLLDVGLWHSAGHACKKCVQPDDRHYVIHDYLDHQTSAERARETSIKRSIAGQRGGKAKAAASKLLDGGYEVASSKSLAEEEQEEEVQKKTSSSAKRASKPRPPVAARFDEFWRIYPKRKDKGPAEAAWTRAINEADADPQAIIDGALLYALERKGQDPKWTKLPATWLNARCWEDEPDPTLPGMPSVPRPVPWCGKCSDQYGRIAENDRGLSVNCPTCHPNRRNP